MKSAAAFLILLVATLAIGLVATPLCRAEETSSAVQGNGQDDLVISEEIIPWQEIDDPHQVALTTIPNGENETVRVPVHSWRDMPFQTVWRQALDYSCGSAALATLLTYSYRRATSEKTIFKAMFEAGNQDKIRHEGFSLLDMSRFLNRLGFRANGYRINLEIVEKKQVPMVALVNNEGYNHFVVVKSVQGPFVLVGDPSRGNIVYTRSAFEKMWNGLALVVTNHAHNGRAQFNDRKEWSFARLGARATDGVHVPLDSVALPYPNWQIAPAWIDPLATLSSLASTVAIR